MGLDISKSGRYLAGAGGWHYVSIWDRQLGWKEIQQLSLSNAYGYSLFFSHDDKYLFCGNSDGVVNIWETENW